MRTIKLKFLTDTGKNLYVSLNYAADALSAPGAAEIVNTAMDAILAQQPFVQTLAAKNGAELIDRCVTNIVA